MTIKETSTELLFVEVLKKETLHDLMKFDKDKEIFVKFGIKTNGLDKIADAITKLMSLDIKANLLQYMEDVINNGGNNGE